jgi:NAD(P)H dehydrogenase (quinone)
MKVTVVLAHPDKKSFNYAIAEAAVRTLNASGYEVTFHDLYREKFSPSIPSREIPRSVSLPQQIRKHCEEIPQADGIIIVHPNWWGQPPAILKGWIDRVLRPGVTYEFTERDGGEGVPNGLLKAKTALVFNTSNTPPEREQTAFGDTLETIWKNCIFRLCGVNNFYRKNFQVVVTSTIEQRQNWLGEVRNITKKYFPALI